jgi:hypothetical protein
MVGLGHTDTVYAVTDAAELISFHPDRPQQLLSRLPLRGLEPGERLLGMAFRVRSGEPASLVALTSRGRVCTVDTRNAELQSPARARPVLLTGQRFGVDFDALTDRLRVVSDVGQALELNPYTGALAQSDPPLRYVNARPQARPATLTAAASVAGQAGAPGTRYGIDAMAGTLVVFGEAAGGVAQLHTVGALGTGPVDDARLDIAPGGGAALAALRQGDRTRLFAVNLGSGQAKVLGTVGHGQPLWGMAIAP